MANEIATKGIPFSIKEIMKRSLLFFGERIFDFLLKNNPAFLRLKVEAGKTSDYKNSRLDEFYNRFEERFRGSPEHISLMLKTRYQKILTDNFSSQLGVLSTTPKVLDLGCGRGEFLDLAKKIGYNTKGVDSSPIFVNKCREGGHEMWLGDILEHLKSTAEKFSCISMFHVVEHLPHTYTFSIYEEVYKHLLPGGMFLVETPSLYSLWVSTRQFYLDPTHIRPIHPEYLAFLSEFMGFSSTQTLVFDAVVHPEKSELVKESKELSKAFQSELMKWENWAYGPMDLVSLAYK